MFSNSMRVTYAINMLNVRFGVMIMHCDYG